MGYLLIRYVPVDEASFVFIALKLLNEWIGCIMVLVRWLEVPLWRGLTIGLALYITCLAQYQDSQMLACLAILGTVIVIDRVQLEAVSNEAELLTFTSVRHARCSTLADRDRIQEVINGREEEVDLAIRSLMQC